MVVKLFQKRFNFLKAIFMALIFGQSPEFLRNSLYFLNLCFPKYQMFV